MPKELPTARSAALRLLEGVVDERRLISDLVGGPDWAQMAPADRAAALRLASDTLRGLERADRILKPFLRKPPPSRVLNLLRLATVELCMGGAAHGVVNDSVEIVAAGRKTQGFKGMVNAVLRRVAASGPAQWEILRVSRLPDWLREPLVMAWGRDAVMAMEAAHFAGEAPLDLTPRDDAQAVAAMTGGALLPTGSVRLAAPGQVTTLAGYDEGAWWVQDAAAALPARMLGDVTGKSVLDMCAAPGGKTLQLAASGATVTALDMSQARLDRVAENLGRSRLNATLIAGDALRFDGGPFDAILLDTPCSATGTIRRHPDLPFARTGDGIAELIAQQSEMIDHALGLLVPGGSLVFCTCSLLPDEGECQIEDALARHAGLKVVPPTLTGIDPGWITSEGGLRLRPDFWPERGGMDGFYMAHVQKPA